MSTAEKKITPRHLAGLRVVKAREARPTFNFLVYGEPGVGKTRLCGSADNIPEMRKVLMVDVEAGSMSIRETNPDVDTVRVTTWKEMQEVYDYLYAGNHDYSTVILDSLTEIQKFNMMDIMTQRVAEREDLDPDVPGMREWGKNLEQMRRFVRAFRDLDMNTFFTALAKSDQDKRTGITTKKPSLSGKLADEVAGFLDIVIYMYVKEVDGQASRMILTGATEQFIAKDRTGRLPLVIQEPSMKTILEYAQPSKDRPMGKDPNVVAKAN